MSRKKAREGLVFLVYQNLFDEDISDKKIKTFIDNFEYKSDEEEYMKSGFFELQKNIDTIDKTIDENLKAWTIERLFKLDLSILRVAVYELLYSSDIPEGVAINEAVEIAKKYGTKDSSKLINGILGTIVRSE